MFSALWAKKLGPQRRPVVPLRPHRVGDRTGGLLGSPPAHSFPGVLLPRRPLLSFLVSSS